MTDDLPLPEHWMSDEEVEQMEVDYDDRSPGDYVISGGFGKRFWNWDEAEKWAREKYGPRFKRRVGTLDQPYWAFLIRAPRTE